MASCYKFRLHNLRVCFQLQKQIFRNSCLRQTSPRLDVRSFSNDNDSSDQKVPRRIQKRLSKLNKSGQEYEVYKVNPRENSVTSDAFDGNILEESEFLRKPPDFKKVLNDSITKPSRSDQSREVFPSDLKSEFRKVHNQERREENKAYRPNKISPSSTSIVLFPGQGSQFVGMGEKLLPYPGVRDLYEKANDILGYDLLKLCLNGPKKVLDKTVYCQPAIMVTSLAALIKMRELYPKAEETCVGAAGFSVGELSALVFANAISFEDAVALVKIRAEEMQLASEDVPSGMMTVFCAHDTKLNFAVHAANEYCRIKLNIERPVCHIANYLYPECKVVAGNIEALEFISKNAHDFRIRHIKRLPVSGAFHSEIMSPAKTAFSYKLRNIQLRKPSVPVHSNVTSDSYRGVKDIVDLLPKQLVKPVKWEQIMHVLYSRNLGIEFPKTYEMGPSNHLGILLKKVNAKAGQSLFTLSV